MTASPDTKILYVVHDGKLYGSQHSLLLLLKYLPPSFRPVVSIARTGPLAEALSDLNISVETHQRLAWFKHDPPSGLARFFYILSLLVVLPIRVWRLCRVIQKHDIQLVHTNSVVSLEGALAAKWMGIPHVWHIRELFMAPSPKLVPLLGRLCTQKLILALSSKVLCISEAVLAQFPKGAACQLVYNAVEETGTLPTGATSKQQASLRSGITFGYVGRLSSGKGFLDLLKAFLALLGQSSRQVPVNLLVAGDYADALYQKEVEAFIATHALEGHVTFLGHQASVQPLYQQMDCLVVPSLNEPFGRVVIEAMACGTPCIAAASGGIIELIDDGRNDINASPTGWLYPPTDVSALKACMEAFYEMKTKAPEKIATIIHHAQKKVSDRFSIRKQMQVVTACYTLLLTATHSQTNSRKPT